MCHTHFSCCFCFKTADIIASGECVAKRKVLAHYWSQPAWYLVIMYVAEFISNSKRYHSTPSDPATGRRRSPREQQRDSLLYGTWCPRLRVCSVQPTLGCGIRDLFILIWTPRGLVQFVSDSLTIALYWLWLGCSTFSTLSTTLLWQKWAQL